MRKAQKVLQVFVYNQKRKMEFGRFKDSVDYVGDFGLRTRDRKRIIGTNVASMARTLAINLKAVEFDQVELMADIMKYEALIRSGAFIGSGDVIGPLSEKDLRDLRENLSDRGIELAEGPGR